MLGSDDECVNRIDWFLDWLGEGGFGMVMKRTAKRNDISSNAVAMTLILTYLTLSMS
jgi:hypothetical protein